MPALDGAKWYLGLEGHDQGPEDAAHWVQVYTSLLRTLSAVAMEVPEARPRVDELRHRLRHWQRVLVSRSGRYAPPADLHDDFISSS